MGDARVSAVRPGVISGCLKEAVDCHSFRAVAGTDSCWQDELVDVGALGKRHGFEAVHEWPALDGNRASNRVDSGVGIGHAGRHRQRKPHDVACGES